MYQLQAVGHWTNPSMQLGLCLPVKTAGLMDEKLKAANRTRHETEFKGLIIVVG
jgi:hypothetical protein